MADPKPNSPEDLGFKAPLVFPIPDRARVAACRSCEGAICWIVTRDGKKMPVEALNRTHNGKQVHRGESHFAHCPNAAQHRRPR